MIQERISRRRALAILGGAGGAALTSGCGFLGIGGVPEATFTPEPTKVIQPARTPTPRVVEKEVTRIVEKTVKAAVETATVKPTGTPDEVPRLRTAVAQLRETVEASAPAFTPTLTDNQRLARLETQVASREVVTDTRRLAVGTPLATETPAVELTKVVEKGLIDPAQREGDNWLLEHPDGGKTEARVLPEGFMPDKGLRFATDIEPLKIGRDLTVYKDWKTALDTKRSGGPLSGYNYDYNDFCNNVEPAFQCNVQLDMYAWRVFQGQEIEVPGIGRLEGGDRRSVVLIVLNLDGSVHPWDSDGDGPVKVKRGFTATGRIFDGEKNVDVLERNLSGHWLFRQAYGTPEKSYIGVADSPDNAKEVLLVTVQRKQWGFEQDRTTKRMEFQLIRADLVTVK